MLASLARTVVHRRRLVLVLAVVFMAVAGALGGGVASRLSNGGFEDPAAASTLASRALQEQFGVSSTNLVLLVTSASGNVDDPAAVRAGEALTAELAGEPGLAGVVSYWSLGSPPPLRSTRGDQALVLASIAGDEDTVRHRIEELSPVFTRAAGATAPISVAVTGDAEIFRQVGETIEADLARAELIAVPITLVLLVVVFGSVVAASLPLLVGGLTVLGTFLVLTVLSSITTVSIFALNLTTALGLGLAIDYALFVVSRFREELHAGHEPHAAVVRTVRTAGRTVLFSASTVAISLAALLVFPLDFLRSFAYAGIAVALLAAITSVVVLPAVLALLGRRVDALRVRRREPTPAGAGVWHRIATAVMRRPVGIATAVVALLLVLGTPFLHVEFGLSDHRVLPAGTSSRQAAQAITDGFASEESGATEVVATGLGDPAGRTAEIDAYAAQLSALDRVARVDALTGSYLAGVRVVEARPGDPLSERFRGADGTWFSVVPSVEPVSPDGEALVRDVRAVAAPFEVLVGGPSARLVDSKAAVFSRVPLALGIIGLVTFAVLFLMFGSLLVPLKAVVLNLLSLTATFGAMVWIFQDGRFTGVLDFTATGTLDTTMPILMFCIAFGLSMDYEVFLLSRIKEEHDRGADNVTSVAVGLERTGRIVTAAAVLLAVVFVAFATSGVSFIVMFGVGLALAVLMDAFLIRATLVPAFMRLAGDANWWAPRPLRRLHDRIGISEHVELDGVAPGPAPTPRIDPATVARVHELVNSGAFD